MSSEQNSIFQQFSETGSDMGIKIEHIEPIKSIHINEILNIPQKREFIGTYRCIPTYVNKYKI